MRRTHGRRRLGSALLALLLSWTALELAGMVLEEVLDDGIGDAVLLEALIFCLTFGQIFWLLERRKVD